MLLTAAALEKKAGWEFKSIVDRPAFFGNPTYNLCSYAAKRKKQQISANAGGGGRKSYITTKLEEEQK